MLFDVSNFRAPLPRGALVFVSGANQVSKIRGLARLGIPVGVSVNQLHEPAITALIDLQQPVMIDNGAFSEVVFIDEGPRIVSPVTDQEWRRRLRLCVRLASSLREKAFVVAPDQVGSQQETLRRLSRYRSELAIIANVGSILLLPLQVGPTSHAEFYEAAMLVAGVPLTPAMPMRKAAMSVADVVKFIEHVRPPHIHLLGIGVDNRRAPKLLRAIEHYSAAPGSAWILIGFAP